MRQGRPRLFGIVCDHDGAPGKGLAADLQRVGDVSARSSIRMRIEVGGQVGSGRLEGRRVRADRTSRCGTQAAIRPLEDRRLLEHDVGVGAADAERADAGPPRRRARPAGKLRVDEERTVAPIDLRSAALEVQARRISRCSSASAVLMSPATPAAASRWPMLVFTDPIAQRPFPLALARNALVSAGDLDRIAERRAGAVRLDVGDRPGIDAGHRLRHGDHLGLALDARRGVADLVRRRRC